MIYLFLLIFFFIIILSYFRIADHYNIIDSPNERSSHTEVTIRGGGVIFLAALLTAGFFYLQYWILVLGGLLIGVISFLDDRHTLSNKIRIIVHVIAVSLMFVFLGIFRLPFFMCLALYILVIGIINVYNFMDGINGITGSYSLVVLAGLQYINTVKTNFIQPDLIWFLILACFVFLFFNFRTKAKCFAGDVGSVTIAYCIVMLLLKLILKTNEWKYILFLSVYGVDSVLTIIHRLLLRQNIFKAHRMHFYQVLANEQRISHLVVSTGYALLQILIIAFVVSNRSVSDFFLFLLTIVPLVGLYISVKPLLMRTRG